MTKDLAPTIASITNMTSAITPQTGSHGVAGANAHSFSRMLPETLVSFDIAGLQALATQMTQAPEEEIKDEPDTEENPYIPAGFTYLGQLVDHDLTFDTTSQLDGGKSSQFSNKRTPRFDLDCVYGSGPDDQPYLYDKDKKKLQIDPAKPWDLPRAPGNMRALIGDPRNDENSIVCQLQLSFLKFHNALVDKKGFNFAQAQQEVRYCYQRILLEDFLPRLIRKDVLECFLKDRAEYGRKGYKLYTPELWGSIPIEFAGAAYRMGHSMVRSGYRMSTKPGRKPVAVFKADDSTDKESLVGFEPLSETHRINWEFFFADSRKEMPGKWPTPGYKAVNNVTAPDRLQFSYKLDTTVVDPLAHLPSVIAGQTPSLIERNLRRGNGFKLATGQQFVKALNDAGVPAKAVAEADLNCRDTADSNKRKAIPERFQKQTPLWFYVLAEAEAEVRNAEKGAVLKDAERANLGAQLGDVGGRIVAEVFYGLLDGDPESFVNAGSNWSPVLSKLRMWDMLVFADSLSNE
jgi:Animal haem peroxidase